MLLRELLLTRRLSALMEDRRLQSLDRNVYLRLLLHPLDVMSAHAAGIGVSIKSIRRAAARLLETEWVFIGERRGRGRSIILVPWMPPAVEAAIADELHRIRSDVHYVGEWLMKCILDLLVKETNVWENARLSWAVAGDGGGRLEFDRWYPTWRVAVEFQGSQHFTAGTPFSTTEEELRQQMRRDTFKAGLCSRHGATLVEVRPAELTFDTMCAKLTGLLPLIPVQHSGPLFVAVAQMCQSYINHVNRLERSGSRPPTHLDN